MKRRLMVTSLLEKDYVPCMHYQNAYIYYISYLGLKESKVG